MVLTDILTWNVGSNLLLSLDNVKGVKGQDGKRVSWKDIDYPAFQSSPYKYIQELFVKQKELAEELGVNIWEKQVLLALHLSYWIHRVTKPKLVTIPSLNDESISRVKPGQIVRFHCMIQDRIGSEFSTSVNSVNNPVTGEVSTAAAILRDHEFDDNEFGNVYDVRTFTEKETFLGISPPGETPWVSKSVETDAENVGGNSPNKRVKVDDPESVDSFVLPGYRLLCPSLFAHSGTGRSMACLLKMNKYEDDELELKTNDIIEVTGLFQAPKLSVVVNPEQAFEEMMYPELLKLPVLHVFSCVKLANGNPQVPVIENKMFPMFPMTDIKVFECVPLMRDLLSIGLAGDRYAAAYAMVALVAKVHFNEKDAMQSTPGKLVLNISGVTPESGIAEVFELALSGLVPGMLKLEFNVDKFNEAKLTSRKNMSTNQLEPGLLQMPVGTTLLIDETRLGEGKFEESGISNLMALKNVLTNQKVKYDYTYQYPELEANFPTIILSDSPSVLDHDVRIKISHDYDKNLTTEERKSRIKSVMDCTEKIKMLRNYLSMHRGFQAPSLLFDPSDDSLMNDFTDYLRQRNSSPLYKSKMSGKEYSAFLTCCRMWDLLEGYPHVKRETFMFWKELERIRDTRVKGI